MKGRKCIVILDFTMIWLILNGLYLIGSVGYQCILFKLLSSQNSVHWCHDGLGIFFFFFFLRFRQKEMSVNLRGKILWVKYIEEGLQRKKEVSASQDDGRWCWEILLLVRRWTMWKVMANELWAKWWVSFLDQTFHRHGKTFRRPLLTGVMTDDDG